MAEKQKRIRRRRTSTRTVVLGFVEAKVVTKKTAKKAYSQKVRVKISKLEIKRGKPRASVPDRRPAPENDDD